MRYRSSTAGADSRPVEAGGSARVSSPERRWSDPRSPLARKGQVILVATRRWHILLSPSTSGAGAPPTAEGASIATAAPGTIAARSARRSTQLRHQDGRDRSPAGAARLRTVDAARGHLHPGQRGPSHTCGVKTDGSVVCWGDNSDGKAIPPAGFFTAVSAGVNHSCGLTCRTLPAGVTTATAGPLAAPGTFISVSAGRYNSCGIKIDGTVGCWGDNTSGLSTPPAGTFIAVDTGDEHACGVKTDGTLACWGDNLAARATPPATGSYTAVSADRSKWRTTRPPTGPRLWWPTSSARPCRNGPLTAVSAGQDTRAA